MFRPLLPAALPGLILLLPAGPPALAEIHPESIVYIECSGADGKTTRGTGVIVSDRGRILTAKHVAPTGYQCKGIKASAATTPIRKLIRRKASTSYDAMLLEFVAEPEEAFHPVRYIRLTPDLQAETITAYGFPRDGVGQVSVRTGSISTTTPDEQGNIETDALTTSGMSGGPVFLDRNDGLVGTVAGGAFDPATGAPASFAVLAAEQIANELELVMLPQLPGAGCPEKHRRINQVQFAENSPSPTVREYTEIVEADTHCRITSVDPTVLSANHSTDPIVAIAPDGRSATITFSLESGPVFDRYRGWIDLELKVHQQPSG
jgi:V8-like Glu-specific endopeptidase